MVGSLAYLYLKFPDRRSVYKERNIVGGEDQCVSDEIIDGFTIILAPQPKAVNRCKNGGVINCGKMVKVQSRECSANPVSNLETNYIIKVRAIVKPFGGK